MTELQLNLLRHLDGGGLVAIAAYGKTVQTTEVLSRPKYFPAGIKMIDLLLQEGKVRYGDSSPYKSGTVTPIILTEVGKAAINTQ